MKKAGVLVLMLCLIISAAAARGGKEDVDRVSIATWFPRPVEAQEYDEIGTFMEQHPEIRVDFQLLEGSRYEELLGTRVNAGDIPDIMLLMTPQVKAYGNMGLLADVSDFPAGRMQKEIISLNDALTVNGKTVAINGSAGVVQHPIFYNKVMFEKYGLQEPETREDFENICKVLYEAGEDVFLLGGADTWPYKHVQFALGFTNQVSVALQEAGTVDLMEALYKGVKPSSIYGDTLRYFEYLVGQGYISRTGLTMTWPESFRYFTDGNAAMFPQGPWVIGMSAAQSDPPIDPELFELGVFFFPEEKFQGNRYFQGYLEYNYALAAHALENPAAIQLFEFLTSEENLSASLSSAGRPTLFPLELDIDNPVEEKMHNDLSADDVEIVVFSFPEATGWGEVKMPEAFKAVHAGESSDRALEALDVFYANHKGDIVP